MAIFTSRLGFPWKRSSGEPSALKFDSVYREAIVNLAWRANPHTNASAELPYRERRIFTLDLLASGPLADFDRTTRELFTILGGGSHERLHTLNDKRIEHNEERVIERFLVSDEDHVTLASLGNSYSMLSAKVVPLFRNGEALPRDYARLKRVQKNKRLVQVLYSPLGGRERGYFRKAYQGYISRFSDKSLTLQTSEGYRTLRFDGIRRLDLLPRFAKPAEGPVFRLNMFIDQYDLDAFAVVINYGYRDDPRLSRVGHWKPEARKALTVNEITTAVIEHKRLNGGDL